MKTRKHFIYFLLTFTSFSVGINCQFTQLKDLHQAQLLSSNELQYLSSISDVNHFEKALDNIIEPRVVGTESHEKVFKYIVNELTKLKWQVHVDEFAEDVPIFGRVTFKNIIATVNPYAERFLVLACHYDSKYYPNFKFQGATDSAVPCAMMLNLAYTMGAELNNTINDVGVKFIFFDGEEAIKDWTKTDSIYGARHLAQLFENNLTLTRSTSEIVTDLHRIDLLVLLDLLGAKNPSFYNFFRNTGRWFTRLYQIEKKLKRKNLLKNHNRNYFQTQPAPGLIEDDHLPFLQREVPILHLITLPFPREWHTEGDNRSIVDQATVENLNLILRVFVSEYLHLSISRSSNSDESATPFKIEFFTEHVTELLGILVGILSLIAIYLFNKYCL